MLSKKKQSLDSTPCCLMCNQSLHAVGAQDHPEGLERVLLCTQHETIPAVSGLSEVYAMSDFYVRDVAEISSIANGQFVKSAWYTTQWFSLLMSLSSDDLLLLYPIMRRASIAYIPSTLRAAGSPKGLLDIRQNVAAEVPGLSNSGMQKAGLRGIIAAIDNGLKIDGIALDSDSLGTINSVVTISFSGYYRLQVAGDGWIDLGYEREADDLSLEWFNGREPT